MKFNFRSLLLIAVVGVFTLASCKKDGCTDPEATNYDEDADENDGSCEYDDDDNQGETITITDGDLATGEVVNWTSNNEYILDGLVFVENGTTLEIEAGTVIKGITDPTTDENTSSLIVTAGSKINAVGTADNPIIFTTESDPLDGSLLPSDCGLWGGLIVLGNAPVYSDGNTTVAIEGLPSNETRGNFGGNAAGDNSGTLKYVSIRHSGVGIAPGDEIQGLTLGGVGSGTTIDYVEVYASCDDGIEIFGGTVDIRHFAVSFATDDSYDFDIGWQGTAQFVFAMQLPGGGDAYDKAGEWDGAKPDNAELNTTAPIANATFIGPGSNATGASNAIVMRDGFGGKLINSILCDFPGVGIEVEDLADGTDSYQYLQDGDIVIAENTWSAFVDASTTDELVKITELDAGEPSDPDASDLKTHLADNNNTVVSNAVVKAGRTPGGNTLNPIPSGSASGSTSASGVSNPGYRGAFDPSGSNWLEGWTALSAYNH